MLLHYAETKEIIQDSLNLKGNVYEPEQNSFSLLIKVLQTLALYIIKFIHYTLNKFSIELNRNIVQSSVNEFSNCTVRLWLNDHAMFHKTLIEKK